MQFLLCSPLTNAFLSFRLYNFAIFQREEFFILTKEMVDSSRDSYICMINIFFIKISLVYRLLFQV